MNFIDYANSRQTESNLRLDNIRVLLEILGNPEKKLKFIHVAGTNGKGSVCSFLQNIFTCAGYGTGKYISPELIKVNERISVDGKDISDNDILSLLSEIKPAAKSASNMGYAPSQFEIWTAMAFIYFSRMNTDIVILETGLGGIGDATNIIPAPAAAVITKIARDHTDYLGETIEKITHKKCGIIKKGSVVVTTDEQEKAAADIMENTAAELSVPVIKTKKPRIHSFNGSFEVFDYGDIKDIEIRNMCGPYQVSNACIAIETASMFGISEENIKKGIYRAENPARFEFLGNNIVYDGAHNPDGMRALKDSLIRYFPGKKISFVFAAMADKDINSGLEHLVCFKESNFYTITAENNPRSVPAEDLADILQKAGFHAAFCENSFDAIKSAAESGDVTVIMGSLYLYAQIRRCIRKFPELRN
ncbi:MAG: bifunctional folylpolyglutamate synthase/dihydrofolate synthase [Oscillospiraceae bacterium]|nr:bifunctional folylpolyglutamate synthase/dihydrofolate synthase [Oscillospiraceae bacterium]